MHAVPSTIIGQVDFVGDAFGIMAAIVLSFVSITLIASYYRFQHIVAEAEEKNPEEMGVSADEILRVQLARYLTKCARLGSSFSLSLIRTGNPNNRVEMQSPVVTALKQAVRRDDIVCVHDTETAALLTEAEPEDAESMLARISGSVAEACIDLELNRMRVGVASYPGHGLSGKDLLGIAQLALEQANGEQPILLPEISGTDDKAESEAEEDGEFAEDQDELDEEDTGPRKGRQARRDDAILDPVTGVLKPESISAYMQRMMSDLRYKKQKAALFCIGVNNMEHIARFHGEDTANDVLAGVSKVLQDNLRADDLIGRHEQYAFLALVRCSLEEVEGIGKRISTLIQKTQFSSASKNLKTTITLGVAAYPEHGRNLHHLYKAGQKVLDHSRTNDIRAYAVYDPQIHDKVPVKPMRNIKSVQA